MTTTTLSNLLIFIGIVWIIAGYFSYMQTVKINGVVHELGKKAPRLYSGKNAGFPRTRRIVFVAAADSGMVKEARIITAAFIIKPAKILPFDALVGKNLHHINLSELKLEPVIEKALMNVLKDFKARN